MKKRRLIFLSATIVGVIVLGSLGYVLISNMSSGNDLKKIQGKYAMSERELRDIVKSKHLTVYWAGPVVGDKYALTIGAAGQTFVRYLPNGKGLTTTGSTFRIIATYSLKGAFLATQTAGTQTGNVGFTNVDGNSVFYVKTRPTNVYMGIKGQDIQLEIFDPAIDQALALALFHGQIQPIN
ncbi:MAG TPA: hypothetical protein VF307_06995 [Candidatus Nanopelagicaceae bacterium]